MARIRSIKPEFWTDEKVMDVSPLARLLFIGLWNFCDDHGHMPCAPRTIKAQIFPEDAIGAAEVEQLLQALAANGQILLYAVDGRNYLEIVNWDKFQKIDGKSKPRYPAPGGRAIVSRETEESREPSLGLFQDSDKDRDKDKDKEADADMRAPAREADLRAAIAGAFAAAHAPAVPDTSRVALWLSQRYEPAIILAVVTEIVRRKPNVGSLNYFDTAIREAHAQTAPQRIELARPDSDLDIEAAVKLYARTQRWSRWAGPEPGMLNCRAGPELLAKYGLRPDGRKMEPEAG